MKRCTRSQVMWFVVAALLSGGVPAVVAELKVSVASPEGAPASATSQGTLAADGAAPSLKAEPRTWLGTGVDEIGDDVRAQLPLSEGVGVIVRHVDADSPAAKAGIRENDILVKFGDQLLVNPAQFGQLVRLHKEGEIVSLAALRQGKEIEFKATLAQKAVSDQDPPFGVISLGGGGSDIKMTIPEDIKKFIEQHMGAATVFSTNITVNNAADAGISSTTKNGKTTVTYKGKQVFSGSTAGVVMTRSASENGKEWAAAFDGDKVLWENEPGASQHLKQ